MISGGSRNSSSSSRAFDRDSSAAEVRGWSRSQRRLTTHCGRLRSSYACNMNLLAGLIAAALLLASCGAPSAATEGPRPDAGRITVDRITVENVRSIYPRPDDWHRLALYGNWDFVDEAVWREIAMEPDCDRATALAIFWKAQPEYFAEFTDQAAVPEINRASYDLINLIRERWQTGAYRRGELAFDPESDAWPVELEGLRQRYGGRVDQLMPADMRVRLEGRRLPRAGFHTPGVFGSG